LFLITTYYIYIKWPLKKKAKKLIRKNVLVKRRTVLRDVQPGQVGGVALGVVVQRVVAQRVVIQGLAALALLY